MVVQEVQIESTPQWMAQAHEVPFRSHDSSILCEQVVGSYSQKSQFSLLEESE